MKIEKAALVLIDCRDIRRKLRFFEETAITEYIDKHEMFVFILLKIAFKNFSELIDSSVLQRIFHLLILAFSFQIKYQL